MREIKFRGISVDTNEWVYGYCVFDSKKENANIVHKQGINEMQMTAVIPETVTQFTGIQTKGGVDIYEKDIVRGKETGYEGIRINGWDGYRIGEVIMQVNMGSWQYTVNGQSHQLLCYLKEVEVLGNVIQNPELLNK